MTDFNPLAGAILGSAQAQHLVDVEKQQQVRRAQALRKNVAAQDDQLEHQVESAEEIRPVDNDEHPDSQQRKQDPRRSPKDDERPRLDVKA
ncbi:MAG TPA: hypothetical protein VN541_07930 [Tepidisphaeraceae bacterium]|nr:hypothetical protein [Tepidisphaeraceae bacterium]